MSVERRVGVFMKDEIYKHIVWVGCVICIAPIIVRGYIWGKATDAFAQAQGSKGNLTIPGYQSLDYLAVLLGAVIIAIVIIKVLLSYSSRKSSKENSID
jgi:TRAP-type C4-dicarboxylate transport system permease small subunit